MSSSAAISAALPSTQVFHCAWTARAISPTCRRKGSFFSHSPRSRENSHSSRLYFCISRAVWIFSRFAVMGAWPATGSTAGGSSGPSTGAAGRTGAGLPLAMRTPSDTVSGSRWKAGFVLLPHRASAAAASIVVSRPEPRTAPAMRPEAMAFRTAASLTPRCRAYSRIPTPAIVIRP